MHYSRSSSDLLTYDVEQLSQHYSPPDARVGVWDVGFFGFIFNSVLFFNPKLRATEDALSS
jgi:hypothetical protein